MLGGRKKAEILSRSAGLLFPVEWDEPFGIAVVESMVSGSPVIASRRGSLPELVAAESGRICDSEDQMVQAVQELSSFSATHCRDYALAKFHYVAMAKAYLALYGRVLDGKSLNTNVPRSIGDPGQIIKVPARGDR